MAVCRPSTSISFALDSGFCKTHRQKSALSDPMDADFDYAMEFKSLDLDTVRQDLLELMTDSQP